MLASMVPTLLVIVGVLLLGTVAVYLIARRGGPEGLDIPNVFRPGPSDAQLEKPRLEKLQAWGVVTLTLTSIMIAGVFVFEAPANLAKEKELNQAAIDHGAHEVQLFDAHSNPAGIGCVQCHGTDLHGQEVLKGGKVFVSKNLTTACERLTQDEIRQTIKEGRPPNMPAWGIQYNGQMNDQQVNDIVAYLADLSRSTIAFDKNKCLNPKAAEPPSPAPSPSAAAAPTAGSSPAAAASASPTPSPAA